MRTPLLYFSYVLLVTSLGLPTRVRAQQPTSTYASMPSRNAWLTMQSEARLTDRWGAHLEAQFRRAKDVVSSQQRLVRVGVNYRVAKSLQLTAGYVYASSYMHGDYLVGSPLPEHRAYQQVLLRHDAAKVHTQHRYRLEQRWIRRPGDSAPTYLNRLRYQLRLVLPIANQGKLEPGTTYLAGADELFIGFGRNAGRNFFDQNRAYVALGYQFSQVTAAEVGYLHQMAQPGSGAALAHNHTLQLGVSFNPDFRQNISNDK